MAQALDATFNDDTIVDEVEFVTVGKLVEELSKLPQDYRVVLPVLAFGIVTDEWYHIGAILTDDEQSFAGLAIYSADLD